MWVVPDPFDAGCRGAERPLQRSRGASSICRMARPPKPPDLAERRRIVAAASDLMGEVGHRLLLVLSDGVAFDHGYEGNHADSDARMALREARNRQIGCLSLSVGVEHDETRLMETFGANDYLRFRSWDAMRGDLAPLLRAAIRASG